MKGYREFPTGELKTMSQGFIELSGYMKCVISSPSKYHELSLPFSHLQHKNLYNLISKIKLISSKHITQYHFSRLYIYIYIALIYDICFSLSDLLHSV